MRDLYSNISTVMALEPAVQAATVNGATIDMKPASAVTFVLSTGAIVGAGAFGAKVQDSDDGTTWADAVQTVAQSNAPAVLLASTVYRLGYLGFKRYARLVLTKASGTSLAAGAVAVMKPLDKPAV